MDSSSVENLPTATPLASTDDNINKIDGDTQPSNDDTSHQKSKKTRGPGRKRKADCWNHFTIVCPDKKSESKNCDDMKDCEEDETLESNERIAMCKYCGDVAKLMTQRFKNLGGFGSFENKTELDKYISEDPENPDDSKFNILAFWRDSRKRFPVLSMMAKDVLAMPVSTVAYESTFSTGGRVLDSFRSSLTPRLVEAIICAQDWLRSSHLAVEVEENINELEKLEEGMKDLKMEQPVVSLND